MIPVQNIYYMLSYAFQALQTQTYKNLATENFHNTAELCAAILDKGVSTQLKRGLGRDYVPKSESERSNTSSSSAPFALYCLASAITSSVNTVRSSNHLTALPPAIKMQGVSLL